MTRALVSVLSLLVALGCDGEPPPLDGSTPPVCAEDVDCDDGVFCNGVERCVGVGATPRADLRGCAAQEEPVCVGEAVDCFELEARCRTICNISADADEDGVDSMDCGGTDCDDTDPTAFPGNLETCDFVGHDEDCDPATFGSDRDIDGDGEPDAACINGPREDPASRGTDCDDRRAFRAPGQPELCNGLDDDCDGVVDEGVTVPRYRDGDGDGDGDMMATAVDVCPDATGYSDTATDCDDTSPLFRGAPWFELCDGEDNDCDGTTDEDPRAVPWYADGDGDLYGDPDAPFVISCAIVPGRSVLATDCDDTLAGVHPGSQELCNGLDDDCNGRLDYTNPAMGYAEDEDGDGVPNVRCHPAGDCDDVDFFSGGDAPEICGDLADNDCDGMVDEAGAVPIEWFPDLDGDGWGDRDSGAVATQCERLPRASFRVADCDDSDPLRHPFTADVCDSLDNDCDAAFDEDAPRRAVFRDTDGDGAGVESDALFVCGTTVPAGYAAFPRDCAPADPMITFRWADADMDGIGGGEPLLMCAGPGVSVGGDCNDGDPAITSGCQEVCNGMDDDADGRVDETGAMGCPSASDTMWMCSSGSCVFGGCAASGTDCDGLASNGCEANFDSSPLHCGGCGMSCGVGADCTARACTSTVIDVEVGSTSTCVLRDNGRVACWGTLPAGLSVGIRAFASPDGLLRQDGVEVTDASWLELGPIAWCLGRADGALRCALGSATDAYGAAGHGTSASSRPLAVVAPSAVTQLDSGVWHACGIGAGGSVVCRGYNTWGQLGRGDLINDPNPASVIGVSGATRVAVSLRHSCALAGSSVLCWGRGINGQLGTSGTDSPIAIPLTLTNPAGDPPIDVAVSDSATCVLRTSGAVECTGNITPGFNQISLTSVGTVAGATEIVGASRHFCVAAPSGAYCFGSDANGVLGNGAAGASLTPTAAIGVTGVVAVDASTVHTCALTGAGEVYCWGNNGSGQLGTSTPSTEVPARVLNLP